VKAFMTRATEQIRNRRACDRALPTPGCLRDGPALQADLRPGAQIYRIGGAY
jgi:hypothetical protein